MRNTLIILAAFFSSSLMAETMPVQKGTRGLEKFVIQVTNQGNQPLSCVVTTAHWYSVALGDIAPGNSLPTTLWKNTQSGEVFILNQHQDRMPVQHFWCGHQGGSWQTRYQFTLPDRRQQRPHPAKFNCHEGGTSTLCKSVS